MAKVKNPHDIYAKRVFRNLRLAADFFRHYLPPELAQLADFEKLALDEGTFADKRLRQHFSDLLFRVPLRKGGAAFLQLLLEHKSAPPPRVGVQLLRYLGLILSSVPEKEDLPAIIPVVLYHG
jgi:predicted transposase/invertase (TIGR01784 family)